MVKNRGVEDAEMDVDEEDSESYSEQEEEEEEDDYEPQAKKKSKGKKEEEKQPKKKEKPLGIEAKSDPPAKRKRGKNTESTEPVPEPKKKPAPEHKEKKPVEPKEKRVTKKEQNRLKEEGVQKQYEDAEAGLKTLEDVTSFLDSHSGDDSAVNAYRTLLKKTSGSRDLANRAISHLFRQVKTNPSLLDWTETMVQTTQQALMEPRKILHDAMFFPSTESEAKVIHYLDSAQTTLDICVFSITYNALGDAVIAAFARGVKVRVISDDEQARSPGSDIPRFVDKGIPIKVDLDSKTLMHNKFALIDKQVLLTGSFNWTKQAALKNNENFLATNDEILIGKYAEEFENLWNKFLVHTVGSKVAEPQKEKAVSEAPKEEKPVVQPEATPKPEAGREPKPAEVENDPDLMLSG